MIDYLSLTSEKINLVEENDVQLSNFELQVYQYRFIESLKPARIAEITKKDIKQIYDAINRIKIKLGKINKKI